MKATTHKSRAVSVGVLLAAGSLLAGCAVTPGDVSLQATESKEAIDSASAGFKYQRRIESALVHVNGNYIGGKSVDLGYKARLPAAFQDVTLRYPEAPNTRVVAERIYEATGIPVELTPDVFAPAPGTNTNASTATGTGGAATSSAPRTGTAASGQNAQQAFSIPMDFRGNLADFLNGLCARLGLGWTYTNGTVVISRYITRTFELAATPGESNYSSHVSKGSSASTGATGGSGSTTNGSFSGNSSITAEAKKLSPWAGIEASIKTMLTPSVGKVSVDPMTGTVVVTDSRVVVDQVQKLIEHENQLLMRQAALDVQIITLEVTDKTSLDVSVNAVYKALSGNWSAAIGTIGSLASAGSSSLNYSVLHGGAAGTTVTGKLLDGIGRVVQNTSTQLVTTNRVPVPLAQYSTKGYLAQTTPANGGGTSAGTGVPGLTPGSVTTGLFISALPTIQDNNSLLLRLSIDSSTLQQIESTSTGSGATFQQIQYPDTTGYKSDHNVSLRNGDTLVLVGVNSDQTQGQRQTGFLSNSMLNARAQTLQIVLVTPRVHSGI